MKSTLPWWGFIMATIFTGVFTVFFGAQYAITGFGFNLQPIFQMLAGYMFPGRPLANMYFTTYTYSGIQQGWYLLRDLKLAQQNKLSPKCAFMVRPLLPLATPEKCSHPLRPRWLVVSSALSSTIS
jgi:hypothetical protein